MQKKLNDWKNVKVNFLHFVWELLVYKIVKIALNVKGLVVKVSSTISTMYSKLFLCNKNKNNPCQIYQFND